MSTPLRPMLAGKAPADLDQLRFPLIASPKLDGLRCLIKDGTAYSRSMKPLRNKHVQFILGRAELNGLDGEIIVGPPNAPNAMQATTSGVMSFAGEPDFKFYVFDRWDRGQQPFQLARQQIESSLNPVSVLVNHYHEHVSRTSSAATFETCSW